MSFWGLVSILNLNRNRKVIICRKKKKKKEKKEKQKESTTCIGREWFFFAGLLITDYESHPKNK